MLSMRDFEYCLCHIRYYLFIYLALVRNNSGEKILIQNLPYSDIQKISLNGNEQNEIPLFTDVLDILNKKKSSILK